MRKITQSTNKIKVYTIIGIGLIIFFSIAYILLVLNRYWQLQYFFTDNVYFQKALWKVANFQAPIVEHRLLGRINILGDHFHPTIFFVSLFLALTGKNEMTQLAMVIPLFVGMILAYKVASLLIRNKIITIAIIFASFMYLGTQHAMIFGFHELHLVPLFFWMIIYGFFYRKKWIYISGLILLILTKENMAAVLFCWGLFLLMTQRQKKRQALIIIILSIVYFFTVTKLIMPFFSINNLYIQASILPHNLSEYLKLLTSPHEKMTTIFISMLSFGLLPLLNIASLPLVIQDFFIRYVFNIQGNNQYSIVFHYGIASVSYLVFASIWTIHIFEKKKAPKIIINIFAILIFCTSIFFHLFYLGRGPLQQVFIIPDFYKITKDNAFIWELINHTPKNGIIITMNHLGFPLSDRNVFQFPRDYNNLNSIKPDYIVYDKRQEQSSANIIPFTDFEEFITFINKLERDKRYSTYFKKGSLVILQRIK